MITGCQPEWNIVHVDYAVNAKKRMAATVASHSCRQGFFSRDAIRKISFASPSTFALRKNYAAIFSLQLFSWELLFS